ncbi:MAG: hypothetical protein KAS23_16550 [Anaerohalosphaera sp.]|nr:hypothetical protein [Anaerohalosphaera sp.]
MAKKKKKKSGFPFFNFGPTTKKKQTKAQKKAARERLSHRLLITVIIVVVCGIFAGIGFGFYFLEKYVKDVSPVAQATGPLKLMDTPPWFNDDLKLRIKEAAGGSEFPLNANTAGTIGRNLSKLPWLYDINVKTTKDKVQVYTKYRTPLAVVTYNKTKYYLAWKQPENLKEDHNFVILDHFPIASLPLVEITGYASRTIPSVGEPWNVDDVYAAIKLIELLQEMDKKSTPEKPLLDEIENVDVSNFKELKSKGKPQIVLYARDKTPIYWGAPLGKAAAYLEASETEKLATLYQHYKDFGSVQGYKNIELRYPDKEIPRPR